MRSHYRDVPSPQLNRTKQRTAIQRVRLSNEFSFSRQFSWLRSILTVSFIVGYKSIKQIFTCKIKFMFAKQWKNCQSIHKIRHDSFASGSSEELKLICMQKKMNKCLSCICLLSRVKTLAPCHYTVTAVSWAVLWKGCSTPGTGCTLSL